MSYSAEPLPPNPDGYRALFPGDPAPWFEQPASGDQRLSLDASAGRYIILCFFISGGDAAGQRALAFMASQRALFDPEKLAFYGVTIDWRDQAEARLKSLAALAFFWDFDLNISRRYGAVPVSAVPGPISARRMWCILDPALRVHAVVRFERDGGEQAQLLELLKNLPPIDQFTGMEMPAPILYLPKVFEADFCEHLVRLHERDGGMETGFLRQVDGQSVEVHEHKHKRRLDYLVTAPGVVAELQARILRRVVLEVAKAYQFQVTRIERFLIGCYRAEHAGHFSAHRDNTTSATRHRRFAMSVNLNADFDGGEIGFPEYGTRRYKPSIGGALVFSCSLLHLVSPVTRGNRYAFLPFLHDEAAQRVLLENAAPSEPRAD
jgi:predicted 2-oxoglutarate/Fe(II)-dependent dioxygenase YbiX